MSSYDDISGDNEITKDSGNNEGFQSSDIAGRNDSLEGTDPLLPSPDESSPPIPQQPSAPLPQHSAIGSFWQRLFAYLEDTIVLGLIGIAIGTVFWGAIIKMGGWELFIGFFVAVAYYGYLNSEKYKGQTWGKKQFKLRVVDKDGKCIPLKTSILRALVFILPFFVFNMVALPGIPRIITVILLSILGSLGIILSIGLVLLYIFNSSTRQVPHDIIFKTYVVNTDSEGVITPTPPKKILINVIYGLSGLCVFILLVFCFIMLAQTIGGNAAQLNIMEVVVADEYPDDKITLNFQRNYMNGGQIDICIFNVEGKKFPGKEGETISSFVEKIRAKDPAFRNFDVYQVNLNEGYDLGIAAYIWESEYWYRPPVEGTSEKGTSGSMEKPTFKIGFFTFSPMFIRR